FALPGAGLVDVAADFLVGDLAVEEGVGELARVEVGLAPLDVGELLRADHVVDVGADAELAGEWILEREQRPGPGLVGRGRPPRAVEPDEQLAAEADEWLG